MKAGVKVFAVGGYPLYFVGGFFVYQISKICIRKVFNNNLGLLLSSRQGSRRPAQYLTDLDFADDLVLIAELIKKC